MNQAQKFILIDDQLRLVLFGLQCRLDISFPGAVIKRIFTDVENHIDAKEYTLFASKNIEVVGVVDEYEAETLLLKVRSKHLRNEDLAEIVENSQYECYLFQNTEQ